VLVELVEKKIAAELHEAKCGAIMHDAWTKISVHYMGIFACYMRKIKVVNNGSLLENAKPECTLLSVAPMINIASDTRDGNIDKEAAKFNAETMKDHFTSILEDYYDVNPAT
jgi:hypothetical protein